MQALREEEKGFLLLTSKLGVPDRKPLTVAQLRRLAGRVRAAERETKARDLEPGDLTAMGYSQKDALHIWSLLQEQELLDYYLQRGGKSACIPLTRANARYPLAVRQRLGLDAPGCLWARGDLSILDLPRIALVGSRELRSENAAFAREVGRQAARQGYVLVSGNARGADQAAQQACLAEGGHVIIVAADSLESHRCRDRVLYLSEDSFDLPFTAQRALSRNRVIHALGQKTFVAQAALGSGGTWDGTVKNLQHLWSSVYCFADQSPACLELEQLGAITVTMQELADFRQLPLPQQSLF